MQETCDKCGAAFTTKVPASTIKIYRFENGKHFAKTYTAKACPNCTLKVLLDNKWIRQED